MSQVIGAVLLFLAVATAVPAFLLAWAIAFANRSEFDENRKRTGSIANPFKGQVAKGRDGIRDPRVHAGLVFNKQNNLYETQYALSDEAIRAVLFSKRK